MKARDLASTLCHAIELKEDAAISDFMGETIHKLRLYFCTMCPRNEPGFNYNWTAVHCAARYGLKDVIDALFQREGKRQDNFHQKLFFNL